MYKNVITIVLFISALLICGCGASRKIAAEVYEPVDYNLFPCPMGDYVGDTMPFVNKEGKMELYYLYDTNHNGQAYHPIHKYVTEDFTSYEECGEVLKYGLLSDPDPAIGTGSVVQDEEGIYHLFYTGHNDTGNKGLGKECVMQAISSDGTNWEKLPETTFYSPENYSKDDFRDPEVFWVEEEQCYWLLIAARDNLKGGVVAKYTSLDLINWEFDGPLYAPNKQYMLECPSIIHIKEKYYLTYSWDCVTYYAVSDSINGPYVAPEDNVLDGTGFVFYAAKTKHYKDSDYLCGWIGRAGTTVDTGTYQWAGNVLNHKLVQYEDGSLGVMEPDSFNEYFGNIRDFKAVKKAGKVKIKGNNVSLTYANEEASIADMGTRLPTMMLECDVTIDEAAVAGFAFWNEDEADKEPTALCLDRRWNMLHYEGYTIDSLTTKMPNIYTQFDFSQNEKHHVKLICENEIVVMYVDGKKALSSRILNSIDGARIGLFSTEGNATFDNIEIKTHQIENSVQ